MEHHGLVPGQDVVVRKDLQVVPVLEEDLRRMAQPQPILSDQHRTDQLVFQAAAQEHGAHARDQGIDLPDAVEMGGDAAVDDGLGLVGEDLVGLLLLQQTAQGAEGRQITQGIRAVALDRDLPVADAELREAVCPRILGAIAHRQDLAAGSPERTHHVDPKPEQRGGKAG